MEATFKSTETISDVVELVRKAITRPDLPFHLCTNLNPVLYSDVIHALRYNVLAELSIFSDTNQSISYVYPN